MSGKKIPFIHIDWLLLTAVLLISAASLTVMNSFVGESALFERQFVWQAVAVGVMLFVSLIDWHFLRRTDILVYCFGLTILVLVAVLFFGIDVNGSHSWFRFGGVSFQPSDLAKIVILLILSKYFSRRHIEIADIRHIIVSGLYAFAIFILIFLQPDFGSAIVIFLIWLGMVLVSGISKKHLLLVFGVGFCVFAALWFFVFADYQKQRIVTFINPLSDIRGAGYNADQSVIAVGSGGFWGKGLGYGTQSRLNFLPEYETDFIFAAFAEARGFVCVVILLLCYAVLVWRILVNSMRGATNFEILFGLGVAVYFLCHIVINIGMNLALLPVTGITLPFMSYGGSHLVAEFLAVGILFGMNRYGRSTDREAVKNEVVGV